MAILANDTIASVSTSLSGAAIGIIRISGPGARGILSMIFRHFPNKLTPHKLYKGCILDPKNNAVVDEVMISYMKAPKSFTGEDMVEIHAHGGAAVVNAIMKIVRELGARQSERGEFSKRAFLNGKIDLIKAESIAAIIGAKTSESARTIASQLDGKLTERITEIAGSLSAMIAEIEAHIDFPEEMGEINIKRTVRAILSQTKKLDRLISSADAGRILSEGIECVIIGAPNVGKSSLLNALLKFDRAIVTEIPGTTTDTIEEYINLNGIAVKLIDTAGIRNGGGQIEAHGIRRTREVISKAELIIAVVDGTKKLGSLDLAIINEAEKSSRYLVVAVNKCDKRLAADLRMLKRFKLIQISALEGLGIEKLEKAIENMILSRSILPKDSILINARQKNSAIYARESMGRAIGSIEKALPLDLVAIDLRDAAIALKQMTGEEFNEEIINSVFERFCVGK